MSSYIILGKYWAFKEPKFKYFFKYFKYSGTTGGMAYRPSEIYVTFKMLDSKKLINKLKELVEKYTFSSFCIKRENSYISLIIASYMLFDYDFLIAKEIEKILENENILTVSNKFIKDQSPIYLRGKAFPTEGLSWNLKKDFLKIVSSNISKDNSETLSIRFDFNIKKTHLEEFISALKLLLKEEKINVTFYKEKEVENRKNIMMFFSSGRQGLNLEPLIVIDLFSFERKIQKLIENYDIEYGFKNCEYPNWERYYPNTKKIDIWRKSKCL